MRRLLVLALAPALLLGFAGCGSSDDGGGTLSASEFRSKANAICKEGNKQLEGVTKGLSDSSSPEQVGKAVSRGLDLLSQQLVKIRALKGPQELDSDVDDVIDDTPATIESTKAMLADDPEGTLKGADPFADVSKRLTKLGLDVCGAS